MEYVKLKVRLRDDPKMIGLSAEAFRAYIYAMCWCGEHETDGVLPKLLIDSPKHAAALLSAGLFEELNRNEFVIHNWTKHQKSHAEMDAKRSAGRKAAVQRWTTAKAKAEPTTEVEVEIRGRGSKATTAADAALSSESENGNGKLAAALLAADSTAQYLISRMGEDWQRALTSAALMKLGGIYGAVIVTDALRNMREEDAGPEKPYAYLERVCARIAGAA